MSAFFLAVIHEPKAYTPINAAVPYQKAALPGKTEAIQELRPQQAQ